VRNLHPDFITMGTIDRLFRQLDAHPVTRGTKVWATEFGWQTPPEFRFGTSPANQARFVAEAFDHLSSKRQGRFGRVQIGISYGLTDPEDTNDWQSGTIDWNGDRKPSFFMFQRMISIPQRALDGTVRDGTRLRVWGRSNVNPGGTRLHYRIIGARCQPGQPISGFCEMPAQRGLVGMPGARFAFMTVRRGQRIDFAVYDTVSKSYGRTQRVTVR
jgi:hypothetical protein